jgi:hypothetical protein
VWNAATRVNKSGATHRRIDTSLMRTPYQSARSLW